MGTVYLAEQRLPVRRRVALKVIKLGMDSKMVLARFDSERQALSMMEHTNIAKVFECGATETGQPWFAMEYVKGIPITDYCDQNRLSITERIGLFKRVCAGVQHAHLKGVMHRDLKPSNILVMLQDDTAIPKIIDFGLAKAVDHRLVEATLFTEQGVVIGTPEYMSPEQAGLGGLDIDTRSDVYSLGVLLYELLTGNLPFQRSELRGAGLLEMQRMIRETDPPKPSTRVTTLGDAADEVARLRGLDRGELAKTLRRDLDWILMRALEKDPTRRYQSVAELSADLGRFLKFEPVLASPPELGYRVRKFLRRYRLQVAAAGLVVVALLAGSVATWVQYLRAEAAAVLANERAAEAERARGAAETARGEAEAAKREALAKQREATERAEEAVRERQRADELRREADAQSQLALAKEREAREREADAQREKARVEALNEQLRPWRLSVAGPALVAAATARAAALDPTDADAIRRWIDDAAPLLAMQGELRGVLTMLRARARPATAESRQQDFASHPRQSELRALQARVQSLRAALAIVENPDSWDRRKHTRPEDIRRMTSDQLLAYVWSVVDPDLDAAARPWGQEERALVAAEELTDLTVERRRGSQPMADDYIAAAWARYWCGLDREAIAALERTLAANLKWLDEKGKVAIGAAVARIRRLADERRLSGAAEVRAIEDRIAALSGEMIDDRRYEFAEADDQRLHDSLVELDVALQRFEGEHAKVLELLKRATRWSEARAALRQADGIVASTLYGERYSNAHPIDLPARADLVPIGMNPVTKLWEFHHLPSSAVETAATPVHDPATGAVRVDEHTGIVFVLLPGGEFRLGAQSVAGGSNHDPDAAEWERPVRRIALAPFFVARHELTQAQWERLARGTPEKVRPSTHRAGTTVAGLAITAVHPVETVDWNVATEVLQRHSLRLPTEAQWEYACRAGTGTPWSCAKEKLAQHCNLADLTGRAANPGWGGEAWSDGFAAHAPVGSFAANAFGLHDVHGNVWEWCRDEFGSYTMSLQPATGERLRGNDTGERVRRGGGFSSAANYCRSATRSFAPPKNADAYAGIRAAMPLRSDGT